MKRAILLLACLALAGCWTPKPVRLEPSTVSWTPVQRAGTPAIRTMAHDGHLFVIWNQDYAGGLLHHPSCPCFKP